ncbi:Uncharacterised protein [Paucimonas lemoignei]|nr:Uncharacterised protein [Paucimonas lemoignei]
MRANVRWNGNGNSGYCMRGSPLPRILSDGHVQLALW